MTEERERSIVSVPQQSKTVNGSKEFLWTTKNKWIYFTFFFGNNQKKKICLSASIQTIFPLVLFLFFRSNKSIQIDKQVQFFFHSFTTFFFFPVNKQNSYSNIFDWLHAKKKRYFSFVAVVVVLHWKEEKKKTSLFLVTKMSKSIRLSFYGNSNFSLNPHRFLLLYRLYLFIYSFFFSVYLFVYLSYLFFTSFSFLQWA